MIKSVWIDCGLSMKSFLSLTLLFFCNSLFASQPTISLTLPAELDGSHEFYHELLTQSLAQSGVTLNVLIPSEHIPQKRVVKMVESNRLSLMWLLQSDSRDRRYSYIDAPITNGLIGKRVLLIPSGTQSHFESISKLKDIRNTGLVAGFGYNWYDSRVWQANKLPFTEQDGEWRNLYHKLSIPGPINYFPRGVNEIMAEAKLNPHLDIERHLLFIYQRDFRFYLSQSAAKHKATLENALQQAYQSGLTEQLINKYWKNDLEFLDLDNRVHIYLPKVPK